MGLVIELGVTPVENDLNSQLKEDAGDKKEYSAPANEHQKVVCPEEIPCGEGAD